MGNLGAALVGALGEFPPFNLLVNETMKATIPLAELGSRVFPDVNEERANSSTHPAFGPRQSRSQKDR